MSLVQLSSLSLRFLISENEDDDSIESKVVVKIIWDECSVNDDDDEALA